MSFAVACLPTAACMVRERSAAEMPVVTPSAASIDTVKLVCMLEPFLSTIEVRLSCRQRASVSVKQIRPRPCLAIKLMCSGEANCAARTKSPSFSRSSSSTKITMRPLRISLMISSVLLILKWLIFDALMLVRFHCPIASCVQHIGQ